MAKIKSIKSIKKLKNKIILVRCDFDVPIKNSKILDDTRLKSNLETIKYLLNKDTKQIILIGHLGRPNGKVDKKYGLLIIKNYLEKKLNKQINFIKKLEDAVDLEDKIILLENVRFFKEEEQNNKKFAKKLANLGNIYVNNCFATSHREHASISAIQNYLPSYTGLNLENEINNLSQILNNPKKPLVLINGGAKIETKLPVINNFLNIADYILVGGAVANMFFKAQGFEIGESLIDKKYLKQTKEIFKKSRNKIIYPLDVKLSNNKTKELARRSNKGSLGSGGGKVRILDIGPRTIMLFNGIIKSAKTIIWNGPMGNFENKKFKQGTEKIAENIFNNKKAKIIIGGGETIEVIKNFKINKNIFISTGGGVMLEFLAGKKLPGLKKII